MELPLLNFCSSFWHSLQWHFFSLSTQPRNIWYYLSLFFPLHIVTIFIASFCSCLCFFLPRIWTWRGGITLCSLIYPRDLMQSWESNKSTSPWRLDKEPQILMSLLSHPSPCLASLSPLTFHPTPALCSGPQVPQWYCDTHWETARKTGFPIWSTPSMLTKSHDCMSICDPWLQVKALGAGRILVHKKH